MRYLLFDSSCSVCTRLAERICGHSDGWIHSVLSLKDTRAQLLLQKADRRDLMEPALIEVEGSRVNVHTGLGLRLRMLVGLGASRAWRIGRVIAGDLAGASKGYKEDDEGVGRRSFLNRIATMTCGLSVLTGIGFVGHTLWKSANDRADIFNVASIGRKDLHAVTGYELATIWTKVKNLYSIERLLLSPAFASMPGSDSLREMLSSHEGPEQFFALRAIRGDEIVLTEATLFGNGGWLSVRFAGDALAHGTAAHRVRLMQPFRTKSGTAGVRTVALAAEDGTIQAFRFREEVGDGVRLGSPV